MYSACFNYENNHPNQFLMSHLLWKDNLFVPECCVVQKLWQLMIFSENPRWLPRWPPMTPMGHVFDLGTKNSKMATKVATKDPMGQVFDFQLHLQLFLYLIFIYVDIFEEFQWKLSDFFIFLVFLCIQLALIMKITIPINFSCHIYSEKMVYLSLYVV